MSNKLFNYLRVKQLTCCYLCVVLILKTHLFIIMRHEHENNNVHVHKKL